MRCGNGAIAMRSSTIGLVCGHWHTLTASSSSWPRTLSIRTAEMKVIGFKLGPDSREK